MKALVVDDSKAMRMIISRELRNSGAVDEVVEADCVEAAAELLGREPVDLVLSDWNMPNLTGLDFLQWLRSSGWEGVFGFITSESGASTTRSAFEAGAAFVVTKPFKGEELADKIAVAFGGRAQGTEAASARPSDPASRVANVLAGTLRKPVTVVAAEGPPERSNGRVAARYVDPEGNDAAVCVTEAALAAAAGAALAMIPASTAKEWASLSTLPEELSENFYEVANVLAQVAVDDGHRCILAELTLYAPGEKLLDADRIAASSKQLNLEVDVEGYGSGRLALTRL